MGLPLSLWWPWCRTWLESWPPHSWHTPSSAGWGPAHYHAKCDHIGDDTWQNGSTLSSHAPAWSTTVATLLRLNGSRLLFLGDSLSLEHWLHTLCHLITPALHRQAHGHDATTLQIRHSPAELMIPTMSQPKKVERVLHNCVQLSVPFAVASLCWAHLGIRDQANESGWPALAPHVLDKLARAGALRRQDTIVANIGLLFTEPHGGALAQAVQLLLEAHARLPVAVRPRLIWRETAPQHFDSPDGSYWLPGGRVTSQANGWHDTRSCVPLQNVTRANIFNSNTRDIVGRFPSVATLHIWDASASAWTEHPAVELDPRRHKRYLDCTHYCQQSGVLSWWTTELLRLLGISP